MQNGLSNVEIKAVVLTSLNGRRPQLQFSPELNLLTVKRTPGHQDWIEPLDEPLRVPAWTVPTLQWPRELGIELPVARTAGSDH